jgi:hypothetical protein
MNTSDYLTIGLRLFFWIATTMAIGQGSLIAIVLCLAGFLIIEKCLEDIADNWN